MRLARIADDAPASWVYTIAVSIGVVWAVFVFGLGYARGASDFWTYPPGDASMMLTGWEYFRHDAWRWPLGVTKLTDPPGGVNVLWFDAIPLVAIAGKAIGAVNPYGAWHVAIYALQAVFAARAARAFGVTSALGGAAIAVLALATEPFVLRFYHEGLNAHFVVLWALGACAMRGRSARAIAIDWAACLACALLIHPYLFAMTLALAIAAHVERPRRIAIVSSASCVFAIALAWIAAGYVFRSATPAEAEDFGKASTNLLSPFVPYYSALVPLPSPSIQDGTGLQWDGHAFLGIGVIALAACAIVYARSELASVVERHKAVCIALALFALYAPGDRWFLGRTQLVHLPLEPLRGVLATFRATGRFAWPVVYAVMLAAAVIVIRRFGRRGTIAVACASLVQLVDATSYAKVARDGTAHAWERYADWPRWQRLLDEPSIRRVALYPSWFCWGARDPGERVLRAEREIEFLAASRGRATNHAHTGRVVVDCSSGTLDEAALAKEGLAPDTLYAFFRPAYDEAAIARLGIADRCTDIGDAWVCALASRPEGR